MRSLNLSLGAVLSLCSVALAQPADVQIHTRLVRSDGTVVAAGEAVTGELTAEIRIHNGLGLGAQIYSDMVGLAAEHSIPTDPWSTSVTFDTRDAYDGEHLFNVHVHAHATGAATPPSSGFSFAKQMFVSENDRPAPNGDTALPTIRPLDNNQISSTPAGLVLNLTSAYDDDGGGVGQVLVHANTGLLGRSATFSGDGPIVENVWLRPYQSVSAQESRLSLVFFVTDGVGRANLERMSLLLPPLTKAEAGEYPLPLPDARLLNVPEFGEIVLPLKGEPFVLQAEVRGLPQVFDPERLALRVWIGNTLLGTARLQNQIAQADGQPFTVSVPVYGAQIWQRERSLLGLAGTATAVWLDFDTGLDASLATRSHVHVNSVRTDAYPTDGGALPEMPDLRARVLGPVEQRPDVAGNLGIEYRLRLSNAGRTPAQGQITVKPFLLPIETDQGQDGVVLPSVELEIDIAPGDIRTVTLYSTLPPFPEGPNYLLAVFVDSKNEMRELNERNNVTDLVDAGQLASPEAGLPVPGAPELDFYSEIQGEIRSAEGGASHTLRTIRRSQVDIPSTDLWARFMLASVETRKVHTLEYYSGEEEPEKQFYALVWADEVDQDQNPIQVDYYWQAPLFTPTGFEGGVPAGEYRFLTLLDSKDLVPEADEANNLDSHPFVLSVFEFELDPWAEPLPDVWLVKNSGDPDPLPITRKIRSGHDEDLRWRATGLPEWLTVEPSQGLMDAFALAEIEISADTSGLAPGSYETTIQFVPEGMETASLSMPVRLFVQEGDAPELGLDNEYVLFQTPLKTHPAPQTIAIVNSGNGPLQWHLISQQTWSTATPDRGVLQPGEEVEVRVTLHPEDLYLGFHDGSFALFSNSEPSQRRVSVFVEIMLPAGGPESGDTHGSGGHNHGTTDKKPGITDALPSLGLSLGDEPAGAEPPAGEPSGHEH